MIGWRVRKALAADADALAAVEAAAFGAASWGAASVKQGIAASYVTALLAFGPTAAAAAPAGFALWRRLGKESEILSLGVRPENRRQGAGESLLSVIVDSARRGGLSAVFLEVKADNSAAQALYMKHGFTRVGVRRSYYKDGGDAAVLRLGL